MNFDKKIDRRLAATGLLIAAGTVILYSIFKNLSAVGDAFKVAFGYISPVFWGLVLAYLLRPFANMVERILPKKLKKKRLREKLGNIAALLLLVVVVVVLLKMLIPRLISSITALFSNLDSYIDSVKGTIKATAAKFNIDNIDVDKLIGTSDELLRTAANWAGDNIDYLAGMFYQLGSKAMNLIIVLVISIYALFDRRNIKKGLNRLNRAVLNTKATSFADTISRGDRLMIKFLVSNLLDALIIFGVNLVFLSIVNAPYGFLLSVFLGITNLVPTFGPIAGGVIAGIVVLLTKPALLIGFVVFTLVLQQIDGNLIKPLLFGDSTGLSPFWVLTGIVVGGRIFGIPGMLFGVPVLAFIFMVYNDILKKRETRLEQKE